MIYPSLSFHPYTTSITSDTIHYSDLSNKDARKEIFQDATFDFKIKDLFMHN